MPNYREILVSIEVEIKSLTITQLFHLHFGFDRALTERDINDFVFLCDLFLGIPSILFDKDVMRRRIYGRLGDYRPKPAYPGLEYRVMGIGMYEHFNIIKKGIDMIQDSIDRNIVEDLKEMFFHQMIELDNNIKFVNKIKTQQIYDEVLRVWNSKERVSQPLLATIS